MTVYYNGVEVKSQQGLSYAIVWLILQGTMLPVPDILWIHTENHSITLLFLPLLRQAE